LAKIDTGPVQVGQLPERTSAPRKTPKTLTLAAAGTPADLARIDSARSASLFIPGTSYVSADKRKMTVNLPEV
jgi:hypothetical protein